jgi:hypothetical protein
MKKLFLSLIIPMIVALTAALLALIAGGIFALPAKSAPRPDPSCSWNPSALASPGESVVTAINLPTNRSVSFSFDLYPGGGIKYPSGSVSFALTVEQTTTLHVWARGGSGSLGNGGPQLGDYHLIAICTVTVA